MKKGLMSKLMAIVGTLVAAYCGYTWYSIAAGIWAPVNKAGEAVGPMVYVILTIAAAVVAGLGIYNWIAGKKK